MGEGEIPSLALHLKAESESTWLRFAHGYLDGQLLNVTDQSPKNQLRRVLREVAQKTKVGVEPTVVWLLSDTTPAALRRRAAQQLAGNIQARLKGAATFRILESRLGSATQ